VDNQIPCLFEKSLMIYFSLLWKCKTSWFLSIKTCTDDVI